jgi:hypothetical protein
MKGGRSRLGLIDSETLDIPHVRRKRRELRVSVEKQTSVEHLASDFRVVYVCRMRSPDIGQQAAISIALFDIPLKPDQFPFQRFFRIRRRLRPIWLYAFRRVFRLRGIYADQPNGFFFRVVRDLDSIAVDNALYTGSDE